MKREINEKETKVDYNSGHRDPIRINLSSLHNWASSRPSLADSHLQSFLSLQWLPLDLWPSIKDTMKDKPHPHLFSLCSSTPTFPRILLTLDLLLANKEWPQLCYQVSQRAPCGHPWGLKPGAVPFASSFICFPATLRHLQKCHSLEVFNGCKTAASLGHSHWACMEWGGFHPGAEGAIKAQDLFGIYWCIGKCLAASFIMIVVYVLIKKKQLLKLWFVCHRDLGCWSWPQNWCN